MANERILWRPNGVSPEEWARLGREGQIAWYRNQPRSSGPPAHPLSAVTGYLRGMLTRAEFVTSAFERLTAENATEFLEGCPEDLLQFLRERALTLPADDDDPGWGRFVIFAISVQDPWGAPAEIEASREAQMRRFRAGVRVYRSLAGA